VPDAPGWGLSVMSVLNLRPRKLGSFEQYTIALSRSLVERGGKSVLVFKDGPPPELRPHYVAAGATLESKPFEPFGLASARALRALIQRHHPDIVHLHFVNMLSLDVLAAALQPGVKAVFSEHSSDVPKTRSAARWLALRASKRLFSLGLDLVIAPSDYVNARTVREGVGDWKVVTVYNGVDVNRFRAGASPEDTRATYGIGPDELIVVSISQLIEAKGVGDLIDAAALVNDSGRKVTFIHVGDGPLAAEYRERIHRHGLEGRFILAGLMNGWDVAAILRDGDAFTLPCTWGEAFSLVVLEAMAAAKPLIVTSAGGNVEAVEHGKNGLVVPPHDPPALAAAIMRLHDCPGERREMGCESAKRSARFTVQRWVDETLDAYTRLTSFSNS